MMIGAKIMLNAEPRAARDGLAKLADTGWMLSLPRQESRSGHSAGSARPGLPVPEGQPGAGTRMVAVTFGKLAPAAGPGTLLRVRWESVEPGDQFTVLLDADITLVPAAGQDGTTLTLAGVCRLPPGTVLAHGQDAARMQVIGAAREFITGVADAVARSAAPGRQQPQGKAWSWLTGVPRQR